MLVSAPELAAAAALSGALAVPPIFGLHKLLDRASWMPLLRGSLEENLVLASCVAGALERSCSRTLSRRSTAQASC
jgi:hypothetical protein